MKYIFILVIAAVGLKLSGQTDSIEKATIYNKYLSKEISESDYQKISSLWNQKMKVFKKYPDLPLDQNGQVHYMFVNYFKGFDKEKLFNRTLEWLAINYGLLPNDMYANLKEGKIIFRGSLTLFKNYNCLSTSIITVKDEKIKTEIITISYQAYSEGDYASGISDRTVSFDITDVYPVILKKSSDWNLDLSIFENTNNLFTTGNKNLSDYISTYDSTVNF